MLSRTSHTLHMGIPSPGQHCTLTSQPVLTPSLHQIHYVPSCLFLSSPPHETPFLPELDQPLKSSVISKYVQTATCLLSVFTQVRCKAGHGCRQRRKLCPHYNVHMWRPNSNKPESSNWSRSVTLSQQNPTLPFYGPACIPDFLNSSKPLPQLTLVFIAPLFLTHMDLKRCYLPVQLSIL